MINTKYVRDNIDAIKESLARRKSNYPINRLIELDLEYRRMQTEMQEMQAKQNKASLKISEMKKKGDNASDSIEALRSIKEKIEQLEAQMPSYKNEIEELLFSMPNILHKSVPIGKDDSENIVIRTSGIPKTPIDSMSHDEILLNHDLIDLERAAKVAGARFFYLKNDLVLLEQALINFTLDKLYKKGYTLISPPFMMRKEYYRGVTALGDFEDALYKVSEPKEAGNVKDYEKMDNELFMISTAEHPLAAMYAGEVIDAKNLPIKLAGISPCFRREAGSHGKDTKGIFRTHQFYKIEQFIFSDQERSWNYFEEMLANSEEIFRELGIPYRVVNVCTGDLGVVAAKKYDIEGHMPRQQKYRELVSCSNCTDWQSSRLDIKYEEKGERKYVHTLNSTGIATGRAMVGIIENYTEDRGIIHVPDALVKYIGKRTIG